jgi:5'-3' exoribonuclease 2
VKVRVVEFISFQGPRWSDDTLVNICFSFCTAEERQEQNNKRRRVEIISDTTPSQQGAPPQEGIQATAIPYTPIPVPVPSQSIHHSLPSRPAFDLFTGVPEDISPTIPPSHGRSQNFDIGVRALAGSNSDVVKNRAAIRMANMNAAEILKAELSSSSPSKKDSNSTRSTPFSDFVSPPMPYSQTRQSVQQSVAVNSTTATAAVTSEATYFANGPPALFREPAAPSTTTDVVTHENRTEPEDSHMNGNEDPTIPDMVDLPNNDAPNPVQPDAALGGQVDVVMEGESSPRGMKRKLEELEEEEAVEESFIEPEEEEEEEVVESTPMKLKVNPDGTVEQEDKVK